MPVNSIAAALNPVSANRLIAGGIAALLLYTVKAWAGGRRNVCERDWSGKLILVVAPPTSAIISLIHHLLHLPNPPQILYLPPIPSPLPEDLLLTIHTIRLSAERNPLAQLHCEPLPRTPEAVQDFTRKWGTGLKGTIAEDGRRVDAIILGEGWEVSTFTGGRTSGKKGKGKAKEWSILQFQYHLLTSLLPFLLRAPADRSIRIISLVSPGWAVALPSLQAKPLKDAPLTTSALRGLTTLLVMRHFQLILDTLFSAAWSKEVPVPNPENAGGKKRDTAVKSNITAMSVMMPWTRSEIMAGMIGAEDGSFGWLFYILLYPILLFLTPSASRAVHSVLFALSAPIRSDTEKVSEQGVAGGDVIRNCQLVELPPVMREQELARANYEALEREVEARIKGKKA